MDNRGYNNNEDQWVEDKIARLSAPAGWKPDPDRALEQMQEQYEKPGALSLGVRLSLAGATLAVIGVVVALLPWQALWTSNAKKSTVVAKEPAATEESLQENLQAEPAAAATPQHHPEVYVAESAPATPPAQQPIPAVQEQPRRKKEPPYFVTSAEQEARQILQAAAAVPEPPVRETLAPEQQPSRDGVSEPVLISQVQPEYTNEAREAKIQGTVEILGTVLEDGTVKPEKVTKGLGYGLDEAAIAAFQKWKFIPAKKDGRPVATFVTVSMNFALR